MPNDTVIVGCKLPNGIVLRVGDETIKLRGRATYAMPNPDRKFTPPELISGDSITIVNKSFWESWVEWAKKCDYKPYKCGAVYARANRDEVAAIAKETSKVKTGFEPLNPAEQRGIQPMDMKG